MGAAATPPLGGGGGGGGRERADARKQGITNVAAALGGKEEEAAAAAEAEEESSVRRRALDIRRRVLRRLGDEVATGATFLKRGHYSRAEMQMRFLDQELRNELAAWSSSSSSSTTTACRRRDAEDERRYRLAKHVFGSSSSSSTSPSAAAAAEMPSFRFRTWPDLLSFQTPGSATLQDVLADAKVFEYVRIDICTRMCVYARVGECTFLFKVSFYVSLRVLALLAAVTTPSHLSFLSLSLSLSTYHFACVCHDNDCLSVCHDCLS